MNRRSLFGFAAAVSFPAIVKASKLEDCDKLRPMAAASCRLALTRVPRLIAAARNQIGKTVNYDPAYTKIDYPGGDVPLERGVCTDVVIRAYRDAFDIDLQQRVHEDMAKNFAAYPKHWGLSAPDGNIDHRRVPNLQVFFKRQKAELPLISKLPYSAEAGDIITVKLPGNLDHICIVSDRMAQGTNRPLVIHNIGRGTQEEDVLMQFKRTGRFRYEL